MKKIILAYVALILSTASKAQTIDLFTSNGTVVKGFYRTEFTPSEITTITQQWAAAFPNATVLANDQCDCQWDHRRNG